MAKRLELQEVTKVKKTRSHKGYCAYSSEEDKYLRQNYLSMPAKAMSKVLGRNESSAKQRLVRLGLVVPKDVAEKFRQASLIKKGNIPFNKGRKAREYLKLESLEAMAKTMFKKGHLPHNTADANGTITIRKDSSGREYQFIRIDIGHWEFLHRHIWVQHNGEIPSGHIVTFKDGNTFNCDINNLQLISLNENMRRNTIARFSPELRSAMHLLRKLNKTIKDHGKK